MRIRTLKNMNVDAKRILLRTDLNVPLRNGEVADDSRIQASLATIQQLVNKGCRVAVCSHLGRPQGQPREDLKMDPVARRLSELLGRKVPKLNDCVGADVEAHVKEMQKGEIVMLENTRFHPGEKENDSGFARQLAALGEVFVNDAFASAHRTHASTTGVAQHLPSVAGLLMQEEIEVLTRLRERPEPPFLAILGGAKVPDKIGVIRSLLPRVDRFLIGGVLANTFLKAAGTAIGASKVHEDSLVVAEKLLRDAGNRLVLPVDVVVAERPESDADHRAVTTTEVPDGWHIVDIGPRTVNLLKEQLGQARTVVWNGPLGLNEVEEFARGTAEIGRFLGELNAETVIGGGDTLAALAQAGAKDQMTHVSSGGGAFLAFLAGETLPAIAALATEE